MLFTADAASEMPLVFALVLLRVRHPRAKSMAAGFASAIIAGLLVRVVWPNQFSHRLWPTAGRATCEQSRGHE
jgi:hypothetical protein